MHIYYLYALFASLATTPCASRPAISPLLLILPFTMRPFLPVLTPNLIDINYYYIMTFYDLPFFSLRVLFSPSHNTSHSLLNLIAALCKSHCNLLYYCTKCRHVESVFSSTRRESRTGSKWAGDFLGGFPCLRGIGKWMKEKGKMCERNGYVENLFSYKIREGRECE